MAFHGLRPGAFALLLAIGACSTEPDSSHVGSYQLETIDGKPLPQPRGSSGETIGGLVIVRDDRTFFDSTAVRTSSGQVIGLVGIGSYERRGDELEFVPLAGDHTWIMRYSAGDGTLTQEQTPGVFWVYRRGP